MKKLILGCLPILLLSATAVALPVKAEVKTGTIIAQASVQPNVSPFHLAYLAYQGYFEAQGISGYATLIEEIRFGKVGAKQLVQAAVDTNRLQPTFLNDSSYISSVGSQLTSLVNNH